MTLDTVRAICRRLPEVIDLEPPHGVAFKCTPEMFAELVERPGIIPAPDAARHMWVMEQELGETLGRREFEALVKQSYNLIVERLPTSKRPSSSKATR